MAHHGHHRSQPPQYQPHLQYGSQHIRPQGQKRSRAEMEMGMSIGNESPHSISSQAMSYGAPTSQPLHEHHHRLPESARSAKHARYGESNSPQMPAGAPSVLGQPGMPAPAPQPRGPKLKFTPEADALLVELKEAKGLTWKQIAEFFPGRTSGTLQVRYCTKLKAKTTNWTDESTQKLRAAIQDYEQEKWRIIANKVGSGFSPTACREKAMELEDL